MQSKPNLEILSGQKKNKTKPNLKKFLVSKPKRGKRLTEKKVKILSVWKNFLKKIPKNTYLPNPLWTMEFGATYPYENKTPFSSDIKVLRNSRGSFGVKLNKRKKEIFKLIPKYSRVETEKFPKWKIKMIKRSREFYEKNKSWVDKILPKIIALEFEAYQKLEWNCQGDAFNLKKKIVTFRASGVRIRRDKNSPTLVSSSVTQVPYLPWKNRYLSHEECLNIQGFKGIKSYPESFDNFYNTIGNAVNVGVISKIAKQLFNV